MKKVIAHIKGMHCNSCEILVGDELKEIPGVKRVEVNAKHGTAEIYHKRNHLDPLLIQKAVEDAGYSLGFNEKTSWYSKDINQYIEVGIMGIVAAVLFYLAKELGFFSIAVKSTNYASLPVSLLVGLVAGFSTCAALVGGLVLSVSSQFAEKHPEMTTQQKFIPHIFFNTGRIVSFFLLGGMLGTLGSAFKLSSSFLGYFTIIVGLAMLLMGLKLIKLFPFLENISFSLPSGVARTLGISSKGEGEYSHKGALIIGALTFFLPCGFTQAMQLFAISSGSFISGALTMSVFAIGTSFGLLGIGGATALVKNNIAHYFFRFAGVVVILLSLFNMVNGFNLTGITLPQFALKETSTSYSAPIEKGVQTINMIQDAYGYDPREFTVKKNVPVKWVINSKNPYTCASSIVLRQYNIFKNLNSGENVIEFTPKEKGVVKFTCGMGMFSGSFNVID